MGSLRNIIQTALAVTCALMVSVGLFLTAAPSGDGVVLERPGLPARLVGNDVTATAFFEVAGDKLELTMLFSEPDAAHGAFRSRVRLVDGQRHTIVLRDGDESARARFVFRRVGHTVEMRLDPASTFGSPLQSSS